MPEGHFTISRSFGIWDAGAARAARLLEPVEGAALNPGGQLGVSWEEDGGVAPGELPDALAGRAALEASRRIGAALRTVFSCAQVRASERRA